MRDHQKCKGNKTAAAAHDIYECGLDRKAVLPDRFAPSDAAQPERRPMAICNRSVSSMCRGPLGQRDRLGFVLQRSDPRDVERHSIISSEIRPQPGRSRATPGDA